MSPRAGLGRGRLGAARGPAPPARRPGRARPQDPGAGHPARRVDRGARRAAAPALALAQPQLVRRVPDLHDPVRRRLLPALPQPRTRADRGARSGGRRARRGASGAPTRRPRSGRRARGRRRKAWEVYQLLEAGKRGEAVAKLDALRDQPLSKTERAVLAARVHETQVMEVDAALKAAVAAFKAGPLRRRRSRRSRPRSPSEPPGPRAATMHYYLGVAYAKTRARQGDRPPAGRDRRRRRSGRRAVPARVGARSQRRLRRRRAPSTIGSRPRTRSRSSRCSRCGARRRSRGCRRRPLSSCRRLQRRSHRRRASSRTAEARRPPTPTPSSPRRDRPRPSRLPLRPPRLRAERSRIHRDLALAIGASAADDEWRTDGRPRRSSDNARPIRSTTRRLRPKTPTVPPPLQPVKPEPPAPPPTPKPPSEPPLPARAPRP